MKIFNILILLFLLSAFTIGIILQEEDRSLVDSSINNATLAIENITLAYSGESNITNINGFYKVLEKYIKFVGAFALEVVRAGIYFGQDNPDYFEPSFIIKIMKLIVWATIITLLIKPVMYLIIFIVMIVVYFRDRIKLRKQNVRRKN